MYRSIAALTLVLASASAWSQTIGFDLPGGTTTVAAGSTFTLDLQGTGWTDGLVTGGIDLTFNSSVLTLESVTIDASNFEIPTGGCNPGPSCTLPSTTSSGFVNGIDFFTLAATPPSGTFDIASFQFVANETGTSGLALNADDCFCSGPFVDGAGNLVTPTFESDSVSVTASVNQAPEIDPTSAISGLTLLLGSMAVLRTVVARRNRVLVDSR
jgi:hypothetical protein